MAVGDTMLAESVPLRPPIGDTALRVLRPKSLGEAVDFLGEAGGRIVGGATALQLEWLRGEPRPVQLIDVTGLAELAGIAGEVPQHWRGDAIGGARGKSDRRRLGQRFHGSNHIRPTSASL
jgi:FAD binding domain in molybdopterin dehydrogenase